MEEQVGVDGWALVGQQEGRVWWYRAGSCRPQEMGEFYCENNGKPLSNFDQESDIIWFVFSKDASECGGESRLKKGKLILWL